MELYVRLDNPIVLGGDDSVYIEPFDPDDVEQIKRDIRHEIMDEYELSNERT